MAEHVWVQYDGRELAVKPGDIVGRGRHADVVVDGKVVSRKHAQFHRGTDGWFVTDLGSSNGLFNPNGVEVERLKLQAGTTRFSLGPPTYGCFLEVTIPDRMAAKLTTRVHRQDLQQSWHRPPGPEETRRVSPPSPTSPPQPPALRHATPLPPAPQDPAPEESAPSAGGQTAVRQFAPPTALRPPTVGGEAAAPPPGGPPAAAYRSAVSVRAEQVTVVVNGDLTILQPTSLTLPPGTMTAIVGPSGCGKSTLANLLSGRSEPTSGTISIDGVPMDPAVRTRIGVVPQYDAVHEQLTVRRALNAAARLRLPPGTDSDTIDEAVLSTAEILDLDERLDTRVGRLSGGQKKRVSVGYELVSTPVMMVLDEPTSGLDPGLEKGLIDELRALADDGTTTVLVTHSPEAATEADLVIVMAPGGYLTYVGPPDEVLAHFGVDDWADVFGRLTAETGPQWVAHFAKSDLHTHYVATPPPPPVDPTLAGGELDRSWFGDLRVMTARYVRSVAAGLRNLTLLAVQAPVLGTLFAFVLSQRSFTSSIRPRTTAREFVLATVLAMAWIGASNSVREIVKERRTFLRERAVGVAASALVASRWLVLGVITVIQAVVLYYAATSRQVEPLGDGLLFGAGGVEYMVALALIGLASVGIGLVISGTVRDANKAMAILPIVLIPIVLFSGLLIPTSGRPGIEQASYVNPVQWGASATAVVADVLGNEGCNPTDLEAEIQLLVLGRTITCSNPRWQPRRSTQVVNFSLAAVQVVALVALSFAATRRSTRSFRV